MEENKVYEKDSFGWLREQAKKDGFDNIRNWQNWKTNNYNIEVRKKKAQSTDKGEKGTLRWLREKAKKDGFDCLSKWNEWKICKNINQVEKILEENKIKIKDSWIFHDFWSKVDIKDSKEECWNWTAGTNGVGYGQFKNTGTHRIAYVLSKGDIPKELQVQHTCNNRLCCNPFHLQLGDHSKNSQYMVKCGRSTYGEKNDRSKLEEYQVRDIHKLHEECPELTHHELSDMFQISQGTMTNIINGKRWHHIYEEFYKNKLK